MTNRRSLTEGLQQTPTLDPQVEEAFVFKRPPPEARDEPPVPPVHPAKGRVLSRAPLSTRIRADMAAALKRASLERQLAGIEPHTLQDILEEAIEPWLQSHGYLP